MIGPRNRKKMSAFLHSGLRSGLGDDPTVLESSMQEALACPGSLPHRAGLGVISYNIVYASTEACGAKARNLAQYTRSSRWTGTSVGDETLIIGLREHCMINYVEIDSNTVGCIEVHTAAVNRRGRYAVARPKMVLPQGRKFRCRLGFLPCKYIKLVCRNVKGRSGQSLYSVRVVGMRGSGVQLGLGPRMHNMLMTETEHNIYTTKEVAALDETTVHSYETISNINVESEADSNQDLVVESLADGINGDVREMELQGDKDFLSQAPVKVRVQARIPTSNNTLFVAPAIATEKESQRDKVGPFVTSYSQKPLGIRNQRGKTNHKKMRAQKSKNFAGWNSRKHAAAVGSRKRQSQVRGQRNNRLGIHAHLEAIYGSA